MLDREEMVGGLVEISSPGEVLWSTTGRSPGHRLDDVTLSGDTFTVTHDENGNVNEGAGYEYVYDTHGRLIEVHGPSHNEYNSGGKSETSQTISYLSAKIG